MKGAALSAFFFFVVGALLREGVRDACGSPGAAHIRLQVTFDASRFATLLRSFPAGDCRSAVADTFWYWDFLFPLTYALLLVFLYLWVERWRIFDRKGRTWGTGRNDVIEWKPGLGRDLFVAAPLAAALLDIFAENIPLGFAAHHLLSGTADISGWIRLAVLVGSLGAALKWVLLVVTSLAIVVEFLSGPRGLVLRRARYSLLGVLLGALPHLLIPQGQDALQRLVEGRAPLLTVPVTVLAILGAATAVWYCARKLLEFDSRGRARERSHSRWYSFFAVFIPRLLGILLLLICAAAFATAGLDPFRLPLYALAGLLVALLLESQFRKRGRDFLPKSLPPSPAPPRRSSLLLRPSSAEFRRQIFIAFVAIVLTSLPVLYDWLRFFRGNPDPFDIQALYLRTAAWLCVAAAWTFYVGVTFRSRTRHNPHETDRLLEQEKGKLPGTGKVLKQERATPTGAGVRPRRFAVRKLNKVDPSLTLKVYIVAGVSFLFLLLFAFLPVVAGRMLGPVGIVAITVANAVFFGSITVWIYERYRVPVVTVAILLAVVFSLWNDNHPVRTLGDESSPAVLGRVSIDDQLDRWVAFRVPEGRQAAASEDIVSSLQLTNPAAASGASAPLPVVLVAAAGGGLRAAYWTAASLAALADNIPEFRQHLFAISAVSGGSVGAVVFTALVHDAAGEQELSCTPPSFEGADTISPAAPGPLSVCVRRFMADDFLSPVLAKLVAPDFAQRFLPVPIRPFDRSRALEESWEKSYEAATGRPTLSRGLTELTGTTAGPDVPTLLLNTTNVESGRRYVASAVDPDVIPGSGYPAFVDVGDLLGPLAADIPLSTAAHNSARFPYLSPAGRLEGTNGVEYGRIVDGGYFENSGMATLLEVYARIEEWNESHPAGPQLMPIILYLCNDPVECAGDPAEAQRMKMRSTGVSEFLAPIRTLLATRNARGSLARAQAIQKSGTYLRLSVCDKLPRQSAVDSSVVGKKEERQELTRERIVSPPLGWSLSRLTRNWMDKSLLTDPGPNTGEDGEAGSCLERNQEVFHTLSGLLRG